IARASPRPPRLPPSPYTTLFRSHAQGGDRHRSRPRVDAPPAGARAPRQLVEPASAAADVEQPRARDAPPERQLEPREPLSLVRHVVEAHRDQLAPSRDPERAAVVAAVVRLET